MNRMLVIGYGNPHRGDDGVGFHAAEKFESINQDHATVQVITTQQLKPELAESVSRADLVIFIDATSSGKPGTVTVRDIGPDDNCDGLFSHEMSPCTVLSAAKVIYGRCPEGMLITVAGENFGISAQLSRPVAAVLPEIFDRLQKIIDCAREREPVVLRAEHIAL